MNTSKQLTEADVKAIVMKMMDNNFTSGTPKIPPHKHNGVDNLKVSEKDLIPSVAFSGSITFSRSDTYTLNLTANARSISFNGVALNSGASSTTVTFRQGFNAGAVNGLLVSIWSGSTGYQSLTFSSGEERSALFTNSSLTVAWPQPLTQTASAVATIQASTIKALVVGSAQLGPGYYFQPLTTSSVSPGGPVQGILQSSSSLTIDTSNIANTRTKVSQFHLVYVTDSTGAVLAQATVGVLFNQGGSTSLPGVPAVQITTVLATNWQIVGNLIVT